MHKSPVIAVCLYSTSALLIHLCISPPKETESLSLSLSLTRSLSLHRLKEIAPHITLSPWGSSQSQKGCWPWYTTCTVHRICIDSDRAWWYVHIRNCAFVTLKIWPVMDFWWHILYEKIITSEEMSWCKSNKVFLVLMGIMLAFIAIYNWNKVL